MPQVRIIVHGGVRKTPNESIQRHKQQVLDAAAATGASEGNALNAVEKAVKTLESSPYGNWLLCAEGC